MFSVVIPLYNKAHTITRTLKSVLSQEFVDYEVVIVDDGSVDNGVEVIRQYTQDSRIRIIDENNQNQGTSETRNKGVEYSLYDYIAFLDGDDEWESGYLAKMKEAIEKYPESGMYCCAGFCKDSKGTAFRLARKYENEIIDINFFGNPRVYTQTSATVVSKQSFYKAKGFPAKMRLNQDLALFFTIALTDRVVYCGFPLSTYYIGVKGQNTSFIEDNKYESIIYVLDRINLTYKRWERTGRKNRLFTVYTKYEIRHNLLGALRKKDYKLINLFITNLDSELLRFFHIFELIFYRNKKLIKLGILYIYFTKFVWRLHGFPRVGSEKSNN